MFLLFVPSKAFVLQNIHMHQFSTEIPSWAWECCDLHLTDVVVNSCLIKQTFFNQFNHVVFGMQK